MVLRKKRERTRFSLFLKAFTIGIDLYPTLGDFTVKNAKCRKEICMSRNDMWWAADTHN